MIQYSHGVQAHYGYDAAGRKLSVRHIISPVNIYVPMGSTTLPENAFLEWRGFDVYADNIQYFMEKSLSVFPTRLNFDGGYITSIDDTPVYHYYLQDHLGNNRMVVNTNGEVEQVNHYYAFGGLMGESTGGDTQTYKYNGKELDCINGLDWYDYGARNYDAALGRWHVVDPLAEKYYNVSPYAYCNNNPIRFIDPDGRKLLFASGTTEAFKQKFRAAIMYLHEHNADGIIAQIDKSSTIIYITERVGEPSAFSETKKTIYWDPNMGVLTSSDKKMSPTAVLNHEADHTLQYLKNPDKYAQDSKTFDPDYDNKEEMRVITGSEQKTALALDEISAGEVTRTDHYGIPYITKSPTTTEAKDGKMPKNPFIMDEIVISAPKSKM